MKATSKIIGLVWRLSRFFDTQRAAISIN